ncbi:unnamed protein product, partial [Timema podura]|nr:unnamed protein product [Timema podura]
AVKQMNRNQLMALTQNQLEELSVPAMNMYRRRTGIMLMSGGSSIESRVLDPTMLLPLVLVLQTSIRKKIKLFLSIIRTARTLSLLQVNMTFNLTQQLELEDSQFNSCLDLICENLTCGQDGAISSCYTLSSKEPREVSCSGATDGDSDCDDWSAPISLRVNDVTMLLLNGSVKEIEKIPRETLVSFLWAVNRMELSEATKIAVWEVFKDGRNPSELK